MQPIYWACWGLSVIVALFVGGFLKSYMSKKGENLATHEDIDKLVDQVRAVTTTTKEIEAKISDDVWDRQKRWELKRDLLVDLIKKAARVGDAMGKLHAVFMTEKLNRQEGKPPRREKMEEIAKEWGDLSDEFDGAALLVGVVCNKPVRDVATGFSLMNRQLSRAITEGQPELFPDRMKDWVLKREEIFSRIREELGIQ